MGTLKNSSGEIILYGLSSVEQIGEYFKKTDGKTDVAFSRSPKKQCPFICEHMMSQSGRDEIKKFLEAVQ